jgi:hypothetical protein
MIDDLCILCWSLVKPIEDFTSLSLTCKRREHYVYTWQNLSMLEYDSMQRELLWETAANQYTFALHVIMSWTCFTIAICWHISCWFVVKFIKACFAADQTLINTSYNVHINMGNELITTPTYILYVFLLYLAWFWAKI